MIFKENASLQEKLAILADGAKYDVACTSSGVERRGKKGEIGNTSASGICHSFAADGRCISLSFSEEEDCRLITVSNTGCSLPESELDTIFESFRRGSNSGSQPGSGLGLYICRRLMNEMGGEVFAETEGDLMKVTVVCRKK